MMTKEDDAFLLEMVNVQGRSAKLPGGGGLSQHEFMALGDTFPVCWMDTGQFITTFPAGWSPQMVVIVRESLQKWP